MIEIFPNLYVGDQTDEVDVRGRAARGQDWYVIHAAKDPYHRQALGYVERGAPKDHFEYLMAFRTNCMILNLVDVADPAYIAPKLMDAALEQIDVELTKDGRKVLAHCNQGLSRSPTIGLLYLRRYTDKLPQDDYDEGVAFFKGAIYPPYAPAKGMADYGRQHWSDPHA